MDRLCIAFNTRWHVRALAQFLEIEGERAHFERSMIIGLIIPWEVVISVSKFHSHFEFGCILLSIQESI